MQKPKYWIYNSKTNSGRELSYGKDFVIGLYGKELFVEGVFPSNDGQAYLIKYEFGEFSGEWGFVVYEWKTNQEKRNSILQPKKILMDLAKNVELPSRIKNKILSKYGELENAIS
jgi:hypothetical protein